MENINNVLKSLIGILLIFSFVLAFSSCEKKSTQGDNKDTIVTRDTVVMDDQEDTVSWRTKMEEESREMDVRFDSLKAKAKKKGKQAEKEVNLAIENLKKERDNATSGETGEKMKEQWEKFKEKSKAAADSLEKKFN